VCRSDGARSIDAGTSVQRLESLPEFTN